MLQITLSDEQLLDTATEELAFVIKDDLTHKMRERQLRDRNEWGKKQPIVKSFTDVTKREFISTIIGAYKTTEVLQMKDQEWQELYDLLTMEAKKIARTKAQIIIKQFNEREKQLAK